MGWNRTWPCGRSTGPSDSGPVHTSKTSPVRDRANADVSAGAAKEESRPDHSGGPLQSHSLEPTDPHPLFKGFSSVPAFYYVHSYYVSPGPYTKIGRASCREREAHL